uniref:Major facilitator superfamily (MFS) profile domain-containing protein n=1 Tax=Lepeophtheirus salmonis TaxID=72036 RepID=A0A0K2TEQ3_LEPSM
MGSSTLRRSLVVFGAFIIMFTLGSNFTFGNMMVYLVSYMRKRSEVPDVTYGDFIRVAALFGVTQGFIMCLSGFIVQFTGHKPCILIGALIFMSHTFMSLYSIDGSLWQVSFTYGFIPSLGQNLAYLSTITLAMKCFPDKRATISGIVTAGLGIGGFFFNELQTLYLNPSNLLPNELAKKGGSYDSLSSTNILFKENYFDQSEVLDRVPGILKILGIVYGILLSLGVFLMWDSFPCFTPQDGSYYTDYDCEEKELLDRTEDSSVNQFKRNLYFIINQVEFRSLWLTRFFIILINNTFISFYKAFGQTFIKNDLLISTTGSIGGIANFLGRFVFGLLMDKTSYKNIMIVSTTVLTFLLASFYYTKDSGSLAYGIGLCSILFSLPSVFSTQPPIAQERYIFYYNIYLLSHIFF